MPLGGFAAPKSIMESLTFNPPLGHITTFGGHPVCCAAGMAAMGFIEDHNLMEQVEHKSRLFSEGINNPHIKTVRAHGLLIAIEMEDNDSCNRFLAAMIELGLLTESFFFCEHGLRIAPPLTITEDEIKEVCQMLNSITI